MFLYIKTDMSENLNKLNRLTKELAEEIKYEETGPALKFCKLILGSIKSPAFIIDKDYNLIYGNPEAERLGKKYNVFTKSGIGKKCYEVQYPGQGGPCKDCPAIKAIKTKKVENTEWKSKNSKITYMVTDIPLVYNGVSGVIEILNPIKRVNNNGK